MVRDVILLAYDGKIVAVESKFHNIHLCSVEEQSYA